MAEKGGTKILAIVTFIIMLVTIGFSGCVEDGDDEKDQITEYESGDLRLLIETDKDVYKINSSNIIITAFLNNVSNKTLKMYDYFLIGDEVLFTFTTPSNITFYAGGYKIDRLFSREIYLNDSEYLEYFWNSSMLGYGIIENDTVKDFEYDWDEVGKYSVFATYNHRYYKREGSDLIKSNTIYFDIIN